MEKKIKNIAASRRAQLLNLAKKIDLDFNRVLLVYLQEKFLSRLSRSVYKNNFFLKGGVLMYGEFQTKTRATKDIDFLAVRIKNNPGKIKQIIEKIVTLPGNDGIIFTPSTMTVEEITETTDYGGLRIKIEAKLDQARKILQIDIGFGDVIKPSPIMFNFPVLLEAEEIKVFAYSWESVIAEKFEAIVKLGDFNSRLKDFYDIHFLQINKSFVGKFLRQAFKETFKNRGTAISEFDRIFSDEFKSSKEREQQWQAFLQKSQLNLTESFKDIIEQIEIFMITIIKSILNNKELSAKWDNYKQKWINY